jgi:hypothetical protein
MNVVVVKLAAVEVPVSSSVCMSRAPPRYFEMFTVIKFTVTCKRVRQERRLLPVYSFFLPSCACFSK